MNISSVHIQTKTMSYQYKELMNMNKLIKIHRDKRKYLSNSNSTKKILEQTSTNN